MFQYKKTGYLFRFVCATRVRLVMSHPVAENLMFLYNIFAEQENRTLSLHGLAN